jgi:hypothetical protein
MFHRALDRFFRMSSERENEHEIWNLGCEEHLQVMFLENSIDRTGKI